jgi:tetratricopeptide (TPR) repeat protein
MLSFPLSGQTRIKTDITTTPLSSLKEITAKDLIVGETHFGAFIKLTVSSAFQMVAVQIETIDSNKRTITLSIYNFPFKGKSYEHYFYKGVVLYVKEPFYKLTVSGTYGIRVDDPSDVVFEKNIDNNNSIENKKAEGRELVKNSKYIEAYCLYDKLIKEISNDKDKCPIFINKAIVCFHLNLKHEYKENLEKALKIDPKNEKIHFHLIKFDTISMEGHSTIEKY